MKTSRLLAAGLALASAACSPPPFNFVKLARPGALNEEASFDVEPSNPDRRAASRKLQIPGDGTLIVNADPVNNQSKLDLLVFPPGAKLPLAQGASPLEVQQLTEGEYYVVVKAMNSVPTRVRLNMNFKPKDWDAKSGDDKKEDGAKELSTGSTAKDTVDAISMDRTDWWLVKIKEPGKLVLTFKPNVTRGKVTAEVQPPKGGGDAVNIDVRNGLEVKEAVKGDWYIKVAADENGAASYALDATFEAGDPDGNSGDDFHAEGAGDVTLKTRSGTTNQTGTVKDEVSFDKRDKTDWWKVDMPDKGKLSIALKLTDKSSKVKAELIRKEDDEDGERIKSGFNTDVEKQSYWVKVYAPDKGDGTKYVLEFEYYPQVFIDAVVVEIDKRAGCAVMVNKGTSSGILTGRGAEVVQNGTVLASGVVEQAFPGLTRIKMFSPDCRFGAGTAVRIQGGGP